MMHHQAFEAVDYTLRDLMQLDDTQATEKIFGGKTVVLSGDFRQILLVVPKGGREDIVNASLPRSHLWQHVTILRFHVNMRVMASNSEEQRECEDLLHTFTTKICTHNKRPVGSGTTM
jgi:ATP-dependent DNA helicase PIF1